MLKYFANQPPYKRLKASRNIVIPPPLNTVTGSSAAYSLRLLRTAYAGSAIRVRRSNDNAEADIGFSGNSLNTTALLAHCGANSGFVTTWYDQSGNARNMVQATAGAQPRIVNAGVIDLAGTLPAIVCDSTDDVLVAATWGIIAQPFSRNAVVRMASTLNSDKIVINTATGSPSVIEYTRDGTDLTMSAGLFGPAASVSTNERLIYTSIYDGASSVIAKNGTLSGVSNPGTNVNEGISINFNAAPSFAGFTFQEIVLFDSRISTLNRQFLERNQGAFYGIGVA